jgi:hypothetical protein
VVGDEANPTSHLIADMTIEQFKGASPVNSVMGGSSNLELEGASDDEVASSFRPPQHPMLGVDGDDLDDLNDSVLVAGSSPDLSGSGSPEPPVPLAPIAKLLRQHRNGVIASSSDQSLKAWTVEEGNDEEFPTLLEVCVFEVDAVVIWIDVVDVMVMVMVGLTTRVSSQVSGGPARLSAARTP